MFWLGVRLLVMKNSIAGTLLVLFAAISIGQSQTSLSFADESLGFELSYPATYTGADLPCNVARHAAGFGEQSLVYLHTRAVSGLSAH